MSRASHLAMLALLLGAGACSERGGPVPTAPPDEQVTAIGAGARPGEQRKDGEVRCA